eukprot:Skav208499  [mRNA]  locus=scaffold1658:36124:39425:- [translate_table: standard]
MPPQAPRQGERGAFLHQLDYWTCMAGAALPLLLWHAGEFEGFSWFGGEDEKLVELPSMLRRPLWLLYVVVPGEIREGRGQPKTSKDDFCNWERSLTAPVKAAELSDMDPSAIGTLKVAPLSLRVYAHLTALLYQVVLFDQASESTV